MAAATESMARSPFTDPFAPNGRKAIPILPSSSSSNSPMPVASDPMDITPTSTMAPTVKMGPPASSPAAERTAGPGTTNGEYHDPSTNGTAAPAVGAAAATQQPKVVQTAFIHKLYNMLEDNSIRHLIAWSNSEDSFVMSPSTEFSKVLSSYFKHTNISSFVRQLNMYGFHKVSDVFHTGQPDSPLWEFKHGNGSFRRGDLSGLREIKRRASKHALIHRDSFSTAPKQPLPVPAGAPIIEPVADTDTRLHMVEHYLAEMQARVSRSEEHTQMLTTKCTFLAEGLLRCHQWNQELATYLLAVVPQHDEQLHKDVAMMQRDIGRQTDMLRSFEEPQDPPSASRSTYLSTIHDNGPPLSPRQLPVNESRRPSIPSLFAEARTPFRTPHAPHLSISPRRYGSIGSGSNAYSPASARTPAHLAPPPPPPPPPQQHPLATATSPPMNLSRRHTSADIRLHGWQPGQSSLDHLHTPSASGQNSTQWPSSPHRTPLHGDQEIRNALAQYELPRGPSAHTSRQPSPPQPPHALEPSASSHANRDDAGWQLPGARYPFKGLADSGPPTRRSSMASNVHSLLNPAGGADDDDADAEMRKRKRI